MIAGLMDAILASTSDGILVVSANRQLHYANSSASRLVGVDFGACYGLDIDSVFSAIARESLDSEATLAAWQQAALRIEQRPWLDLSFAGSAPRHLIAQLFPVEVAGEPMADFVIQLRDVTTERQALRARDEVIAMIGHELASPATSLVSIGDALATHTQPESDRREMHALMLAEGHRLIKLINDLRAIPQLGRSPFEVGPRLVDPRRLLEHAIGVARAAPGNHALTLDLPDALPLVHADPERVQQVLANLISNAQKYSPHGGQVRLSARRISDTLEISVADQGLGIPASARPRIFERFFRVQPDSQQRRMISGTGLGLAICKDIVEAHGGQIGFTSEEASPGSRFWFTLPVAPAKTVLIRKPVGDASQRRVTASGCGLRVLVVDDDLAIGKMVTLILQADAHRVVAVTSGEEALEHLRVDQFDVVLSDLGIGLGIDGLELCRLVRGCWPSVRFVLATGSMTIDANEARAYGVDVLLTKPFRPADLRRIIAASGPQFARAQAA